MQGTFPNWFNSVELFLTGPNLESRVTQKSLIFFQVAPLLLVPFGLKVTPDTL